MSWKRVCSTDVLGADSMQTFDVEGVKVLVANVGEEIRVYPPVCPHMEEPLVESGLCADGVLTCTKHLWQWDMLTGEERGAAEKPLLMYQVKQENGEVYAFIDKELEYEYDEEDEDEDD
jgi:toluene monooxygenase system ferredoxin subunit